MKNEYKGITYEIEYAGYKIHLPNGNIHEFNAYAGNKVLNMDEKEQRVFLLRKIRYEINKIKKEDEN